MTLGENSMTLGENSMTLGEHPIIHKMSEFHVPSQW